MRKMITLGEIVEQSETASDLEELMKRGLNAMGVGDLKWKEFCVYEKSANKMKMIIEKDISYLFAVVAAIKEMTEKTTVNIAVVRSNESCVTSHRVGDDEILCIVSVKESYFKKLFSEKK